MCGVRRTHLGSSWSCLIQYDLASSARVSRVSIQCNLLIGAAIFPWITELHCSKDFIVINTSHRPQHLILCHGKMSLWVDTPVWRRSRHPLTYVLLGVSRDTTYLIGFIRGEAETVAGQWRTGLDSLQLFATARSSFVLPRQKATVLHSAWKHYLQSKGFVL